MARKRGWSLAVLVGLGAGFSILLLFSLLAASTQVTIILRAEGGCAGGSARMDGEGPADTIPLNISVRGGEPFAIPVPPEARTGVRIEIRGIDTNVTWAARDGSPVPHGPTGWGGVLGTCRGWPEGEAPDTIGSFVAQADGRVAVIIWPYG